MGLVGSGTMEGNTTAARVRVAECPTRVCEWERLQLNVW